MGVEFFHSGGHARRLSLLALALALALAGAGHLACCGSAGAGEAVAAPASELSHEHAPDAVGSADSRCHARIRHEHHAGSPHGSHAAARCCLSASQTADRTSRPRAASDPARAVASPHSSRACAATILDDSSSRVSRLPDRGGTYLRGCAFLI
jgi:hypothetical protein